MAKASISKAARAEKTWRKGKDIDKDIGKYTGKYMGTHRLTLYGMAP
jgi:hypothetical protein